MQNQLFEMADQLKALKEEKRLVEERLKKLNAVIAEVDMALSDAMAATETQNFSRAGTMFFLTTKTRASAAAESKEALFGALREQGYGDLIHEAVNANSLSAFVKEQIVENGDTLPGWLDGLVSVFEQTTVGLRKASR